MTQAFIPAYFTWEEFFEQNQEHLFSSDDLSQVEGINLTTEMQGD